MYKVTRLLHSADPSDEMTTAMIVKRLAAAAESTGARRALAARTLPGVRNGGDVLVHLQFRDAAEWARQREVVDEACTEPAIGHIDGVEYETAAGDRGGRRREAAPPGVYRTLLLRVDPAAGPGQVSRFEHGTLQMPVHIPAISAWQLSPVRHAVGTAQWTHVWEQEFTDVDGLLGAYMRHPIHWAHVDRFFDPECPEWIVKDRICHSFCAISAPIIDTAPEIAPTARES